MKKIKRLSLVGLAATAALFLTGCVRTNSSGDPVGFVYKYLAVPGQYFMNWLAKYVGGFGWALIVLTIIVRVLLLPLLISQTKKSTLQQEKMALVQPAMKKLQGLLRKAKTPQQQAVLNQQMMRLYKDNGISMTGGIGCLPLLIQLPVFAALYAAIRYSPEMSSAVFFGIKLGSPSVLLAILSFVAYAAQGALSLVGVPKAQKKQMGFAMLLSPVMILFVTLSSPAGLGIYFFIGGLFAILQTFIINLYRPRIKKEVNAKSKGPVKLVLPEGLEDEINSGNVVSAATERKDEKSTKEHLKQDEQNQRNRNRNAGKQNHHHDE